MTSKEAGTTHTPLGGTERDFAALADQWADKNWYLPPGGDQSWRDREARRLFGGDGEEPVNDCEDRSPVDQDDPATDEMAVEPGFRHGRALGVILPLLLAACAVLFVPIFMPQILTSDFWAPYEPKAPASAPAQLMSQAEILDDASLRPAYDGDRGEAANEVLPQQTESAAAPIKIYRNTVSPNPRPAIVSGNDRKDSKPTDTVVAKVQAIQPPATKERALKPLPPIGAAYFASHAPAAASQIADTTRPIGQAYFESHSSATTD